MHYRARPCLRSQQIIIIESSIDQQHRGFAAAAAEPFIQMAFQPYSSARRLCALAYNQAAPFFIQHNQKERERAQVQNKFRPRSGNSRNRNLPPQLGDEILAAWERERFNPSRGCFHTRAVRNAHTHSQTGPGAHAN